MPSAPVFSAKGEPAGTVELSSAVWGVAPNPSVIHQAMQRQLANRRQGTASTLTRGEVSGGGRKPWRQKGTGRARQGSTRSPQWKGGGVVGGPTPRLYAQRMPKAMRRLALRSLLSEKASSGEVVVLDQLSLEAPSTKTMAGLLSSAGVLDSAVLVLAGHDQVVERSARNLPGVKTLLAGALNVHDLLTHRALVATRDALAQLDAVYGADR
jgi:large subunit ribosomal protein L4